MEKSMKEEFDKIIEKHMPKAMGEVLAKRFKELEQKERELDIEKKNHSDLKLEYNKLVALNNCKKDLDNKEAALDLRTKTLDEVERNIKLEIAEIKLAEADKRATELHGLVQTVFKSPVYRKSYSLYSNPVFGPDGSVADGGKSGIVEETED